MPHKVKFIAFVFIIRFCLLPDGSASAQKIIWARQLGAPEAKAEITGLENKGEGVLIGIHSDKSLQAGRKNLQFSPGKEIRYLEILPDGEIRESSEIEQNMDSSVHSSGIRTKARNGNSFRVYPRTSAMMLPENPEWSLTYLDGNGNRLWDLNLAPSIRIKHAHLLNNGNCLLAGSALVPGKGKEIWFGVFDVKGREILSQSLGGKSEDEALSACDDSKGNLYVAGFCSPDSTFLGNSLDLSGRDKDGFIACFDGRGNEKFFYRQRGQGTCRVEQIASLADGRLFFASSLQGKDWKLPPFGFPKSGIQDLVIGLINPSTGKEKDNPIRVFPNPAREIMYFSLQNPGFSGKARARLQKKDGMVLQEMDIRAESGLSYRFNVANTSPGAYFISIKSGRKELIERVVVE